jgi:hypothetical protein
MMPTTIQAITFQQVLLATMGRVVVVVALVVVIGSRQHVKDHPLILLLLFLVRLAALFACSTVALKHCSLAVLTIALVLQVPR